MTDQLTPEQIQQACELAPFYAKMPGVPGVLARAVLALTKQVDELLRNEEGTLADSQAVADENERLRALTEQQPAQCTCDPADDGTIHHRAECELNHPHHPCDERSCRFAEQQPEPVSRKEPGEQPAPLVVQYGDPEPDRTKTFTAANGNHVASINGTWADWRHWRELPKSWFPLTEVVGP